MDCFSLGRVFRLVRMKFCGNHKSSFVPREGWHKKSLPFLFDCLDSSSSGGPPLSQLIHIALEGVQSLITFSKNAKTKPFSQVSISSSWQPGNLVALLLFQRNNKTTTKFITLPILIIIPIQNK